MEHQNSRTHLRKRIENVGPLIKEGSLKREENRETEDVFVTCELVYFLISQGGQRDHVYKFYIRSINIST